MPQSAFISALAAQGLNVAASAGTLPDIGTPAEGTTAAPPEWIEVLPGGKFKGLDGRGPYTVRSAASIVAASVIPGRPLPVDYNHQTVFACLNGNDSPAAGWIDSLEVREGSIWAHVDWTAAGGQAVASKTYRFVSPTFKYDQETGEISQIVSVALTNNPNLAELPAIASQTGDPMDKFLAALRAALGLANDADQDAILAACKSSATETASALTVLAPLAVELGLATNASAAAIATAARIKLATSTPDPAKYVPMAAFTELQTAVAKLSGDAASTAAHSAVEKAMQAGKVTPGLKDWAIGYATKDPAGFDGWVTSAPAVVKPGGHALGGTPPNADPGALDEAALAVCSALGITAEAFKKNQEAR